MTKFRRYLTIIIALAAAVITVALLPFSPRERALAASYSPDDNFYFQSIDVQIEVNRDKTYRITETLGVVFRSGGVNTGIIRDIQRISRTTRIVNGKSTQGGQYLAGLSNVEVTIDGEPAKVTRGFYDSGQFHSVTMELTEDRVFGASSEPNVFKLSYLYDMSDDPCSDFVFDVLGYAMAYCGELTATITFPEELDKNTVSARGGEILRTWVPEGTPEEGDFLSVSGNTISLRATQRYRGEGLTVQVLLNKGYFSAAHGAEFRWSYLVAIFALIAGMGGAILLILRNRAVKPIAPVTFFPPENMTLARASAVWHRKSRRKDIASYFLKWAAMGLITLERDGKRDFNAIRTDKVPERETMTTTECAVFLAAFPNNSVGEVFSTRAVAKSERRKRALSQAIASMQHVADDPDTLAKGKNKFSILICLCALLPLIGVFIYYCLLLHDAMPIFFLIFIVAGTGVGMNAFNGEMPFFIFIFPIIFMGAPVTAFSFIYYIGVYDFAALLYISVAWWAVSWIFHLFYGKRTEEAQNEYGLLLGFRNFLLTAEIGRIEALIDETPSYFYNVLPYCLVLGISDKVQKRYAVLQRALPDWSEWDMVSFTRAVSHTSHRISTSSGGGGGGSHHSGGGGHHGSHGGGGGGGGSRGAGRH